MTVVALSQLFSSARPETLPIAHVGGSIFDLRRFREDVAFNAERLRAAGLKRAVLSADDSYWAAVGIFALFHADAVVVMPQHAQSIAPAVTGDVRVGDFPVADGGAFALRSAEAGRASDLPALDAAACRFELHTAGSTGAAKRVRKTLLQLEREIAILDPVLSRFARSGALVHASVPHHHMYGLTFKLAWPLASGRPFVGTQHVFWESLLADGIGEAVVVTSPAHLTRLGGIPPVQKAPDLILSAGAPLSESAVRDAVAALGRAPVEIFGSTETGAVAWRARAEPGGWRPLSGVDVTRSEDGRLVVRSPLLADGETHAGEDLIDIASDGTFELKGRADDVVKVEGKRTSIAEIEARLCALDLVAEAAVMPLADEPVRLGAVVVPSEAGRVELAAVGAFRFGRLLRKALSQTLDSSLLPRQWRFVPSLTASPLGKRRRSDLLSLFASKESLSSRPTQPAIRASHRLEGEAEIALHVPADLAYFEGHFPGLPLVPGVVLVDWAVKLAASAFALELEAARDFQVKFQRPILPGSDLILSMKRSADRLSFEYRNGTEIVSSGKIVLGRA